MQHHIEMEQKDAEILVLRKRQVFDRVEILKRDNTKARTPQKPYQSCMKNFLPCPTIIIVGLRKVSQPSESPTQT
jgi:hypothetical protein